MLSRAAAVFVPRVARSAARFAAVPRAPRGVAVATAVPRAAFATAQPAVLNRDMGRNQWYVHLSRVDGADLGVIKSALKDLRTASAA